MPSFIQLITDGIYTRILKSNQPEKIFNSSLKQSPQPLTLLGKVEFPSELLAQQKEEQLLKRYKSKNYHHQWFLLTEKDIATILSNSEAYYSVNKKDTPVTRFLQEQLDQGLTLKDIALNRNELFLTDCLICNIPLEFKYKNLTGNTDNLCPKCRLKTAATNEDIYRLAQIVKLRHRFIRTQERNDNKFLRKFYKHPARRMHTIRYDYSPTITIFDNNIVAICPEHGIFTVDAVDHLHGKPCPKCPQQPMTNYYEYLTTHNETISGYLPEKATTTKTTHDYIYDIAQFLTGKGSHKETIYFGKIKDKQCEK